MSEERGRKRKGMETKGSKGRVVEGGEGVLHNEEKCSVCVCVCACKRTHW